MAFADYEVVTGSQSASAGGFTVTVNCPTGKTVLGGGFSSSGSVAAQSSMPKDNRDGWQVGFHDIPGVTPSGSVTVWAICADVDA